MLDPDGFVGRGALFEGLLAGVALDVGAELEGGCIGEGLEDGSEGVFAEGMIGGDDRTFCAGIEPDF